MSELKPCPCPICGAELKIYGPEDWHPTFYDLDSGGDPYNAVCDCGFSFSTGTYDYAEFVAALNRRAQPENEPLTLSELYDVDSEPLYFHCTAGRWSLNGWHIVRAINYDGAQFKDVQLDNNDAHIESLYNYGITWLAYRRKPERIEGE